MTRSTIVHKSVNPLLRQTWVFGWYFIRAFRYKLADRVNARSGWLARWIRWPLGVGIPHRWREVHVFRVGGIGDSLMSTPAFACSSKSGPRFESSSILHTWRHSGACPFSTRFDRLRIAPPFRSLVARQAARRAIHQYPQWISHRDRRIPLRRVTASPKAYRSHPRRSARADVRDVRPACVIDKSLIRQYQEAWSDLPRPWVVVNRKSNNIPNKDWMDEHWDRLITSLLNRYTVIEIGAGRQGGDPVRHPHYVEHTGRLPLNSFLAAVAAGDIHVGPDSGPVHVAAAAGKPSVVIYGGYIHPVCVSYPGNINLYTACPAPHAGS